MRTIYLQDVQEWASKKVNKLNERIHENDQLVKWAKDNAGKMLTKRNCPEGFEIRKAYGMTKLVTPDYWGTQGDSVRSILIAHSEVNVAIPTEDEMRDKVYYDAFKADCEEARSYLNDIAKAEGLASEMNDLDHAARAFVKAVESARKYTEGNPFARDILARFCPSAGMVKEAARSL